MPGEAPPRLLGAPYRPPRPRRGRLLYDVLRGDVLVCGTTGSPIPWPIARTGPTDHQPTPVMTDELVRAVRTESATAVCHYWGVNRWRVARWRRALGVPRETPGTLLLWRELAPTKLTPEVRRMGTLAMLARRRRRNADRSSSP